MINCKYCKTDKPVDDFYRSSIRKDGKSGNCKECIRARVRANRAANLEYYQEYDRNRGYTDEYLQSDEYKTVKAANESLRRIKEGEL